MNEGGYYESFIYISESKIKGGKVGWKECLKYDNLGVVLADGSSECDP